MCQFLTVSKPDSFGGRKFSMYLSRTEHADCYRAEPAHCLTIAKMYHELGFSVRFSGEEGWFS